MKFFLLKAKWGIYRLLKQAQATEALTKIKEAMTRAAERKKLDDAAAAGSPSAADLADLAAKDEAAAQRAEAPVPPVGRACCCPSRAW